MTIETVTVPQSLDPTYPAVGDNKNEGDNHIRNTKRMAVLIGWEYVGKATASASSSISTYTIQPFVTGYDYQVVFSEVYLSTDDSLIAKFTAAGGVVQSGADDISKAFRRSGASHGGQVSGTTHFGLGAVGNSTTERCGGEVEIINPYSTDGVRFCSYKFFGISAGVAYGARGAAVLEPATAVDGIHFEADGAYTITAGTFSLYRRYRP